MIPTQRAFIYLWVATKTRSPSDWAHFHRTVSQHTRHIPYQIWSKSIAIRPSYWLIPTQRAFIYLWVATKTRSPSDWAHFYSAGSTHSAHVPYQIWMKFNTIRPSYTLFPTQRAFIYLWVATKTRSPSDLAHFYRAGSTHSAHVFYQIWSKSNDTRPSY